ncbi:histone acetyltransferase [Tulasnella sp. 332]|nr:histone acetyltransferase [Tulasnella sp. 332]
MFPLSFLYPAPTADISTLSNPARSIKVARHTHCSACTCQGLHPPDHIPVILDDSEDYQEALEQADQAEVPTDEGFWMLCECGHGWDEHGAGMDVPSIEMTRRTRVAMRIDELLNDDGKLLEFDYEDEHVESLKNDQDAESSEEDQPLASTSRSKQVSTKSGPFTSTKTKPLGASFIDENGDQRAGKMVSAISVTHIIPKVEDDDDNENKNKLTVKVEQLNDLQIDRLASGVTVDVSRTTANEESGPPAEKPPVAEERKGFIRFKVVNNDGDPEKMIILTGLKCLFQRQLPKMPREYIARLVYDRNSEGMAVVRHGLHVVCGITYRPFPHRGFVEIVFFAVASRYQTNGYGGHLMNHFKTYIRKAYPTVNYFLTYADNYAIGYFKKQGFTKEVTIPRPVWVGYIKDYEGGTLMQCTLVKKVDYLHTKEILAKQREAVLTKIRQMSRSHVVYDGLKQFENAPEGFELDFRDVPGLKESGWDPELDKIARQPTRGPQHKAMARLLSDLQGHALAWAFLRPVNKEDVLDYYDVIKKPMDFSTMEMKLDNNLYPSFNDFVDDAMLVFANCKKYNPESSVYARNATKMERFVREWVASERSKNDALVSRSYCVQMVAGTSTSSSSTPASANSTAPAGPAVDNRESPLLATTVTVTANSDDATSKDGRDHLQSENEGTQSKSSRSASPTVEDGVERDGNCDMIPQQQEQLGPSPLTPTSFRRRTHDFKLIPIPRKQQHDPKQDFHFTLKLNIVFGFVSTTSDLVRRRPLLLIVLSLCIALTIGVALSPNVVAFKVLSFFLGVVTVTPQILIPYAVDLAPPERRASVMAIVISGLLLGIIIARAVGGVIADVTGSWRNVYWVGVGLQSLAMLLLWWVLPDRPSKIEQAMHEAENAGTTDVGKAEPLTYWGILITMAKLAVTEPILIQGCLIGCAMQIIFSGFWVTLTFLLTDAPYHFSTLKIGLFGLIGALGVMTAPFVGRLIDRLVPWVGIFIALLILIVSQVVLAIGGGINIAAIIISCFFLDVGLQMCQVATVSKIYGIDPALRSRLNAVFVVAMFVGQVVGSAVGSKIFLTSGWRASAATAVGFGVFALLVLFARGPHCGRYTWFGWEGGASFTKKSRLVVQDEEKDVPIAGRSESQEQAHQDPEKIIGEGLEAQRTVVAVGDIHGDLPNLLAVLKMSGVVNENGEWSGMADYFVQTGDSLDRGDDTIKIYRYYENLRLQAQARGGDLRTHLGNHEIMNLLGDWRYVWPSEIDTFESVKARQALISTGWIGQAWRTNYSITTRLPLHPALGSINTDYEESSAGLFQDLSHAALSFCHGGLAPTYSKLTPYPRAINDIGNKLVARLQDRKVPPSPHPPHPYEGMPVGTTDDEQELYGENGPLWYRGWALGEDHTVCGAVDDVLKETGVKRLVMGHTPDFEHIVSRCDGKIIIIDTGITHAYGGVLSAAKFTYSMWPSDVKGRWIVQDMVTAIYPDWEEVLVNEVDEIQADFL